jgi:hypothetical protein
MVVVAVHVGLFRLFSRPQLSAWFAIGTIAVLALKYLWWGRRR